MRHIVQPGDSLWSIAGKELGKTERWPEIARLNILKDVDHLWVGQSLALPERKLAWRSNLAGAAAIGGVLGAADWSHHAHLLTEAKGKRRALAPVNVHIFIFADEINPLRRKLVRKIGMPTKPVSPEVLEQIMKPEKYGFHPRDPLSNVSIGRHVGQNMTNSKYLSASERPLGTPRFPEQDARYWIDAEKAEAAGVKFHENIAIQKDLDRVLQKARKAKDFDLVEELERIKKLSAVVDREVLVEGAVPASAIKGAAAMGMTRGLQVVSGVGIALSVYDVGKAAQESYRTKSVVPVVSETGRQAGGWAGAWAGAEIGGATGALFGIETGPGAVITGAIGAAIFGTAGFFGADWAVKRLGGK